MTTPAQSAQPIYPAVPLGLRRPAIIAGAIGAAVLAFSVFLESPLFGLLFLFGLSLGFLNLVLTQRAVAKVTSSANPSKGQMAVSSMTRLLIITVLALVVGFLLRRAGYGMTAVAPFFGLAVFQVVLVLNTTVPVMRGLRQND